MALAVVAARLAGLPQLALLIALPALALAATRGQNRRRQMFFAALAMLAALLWWFLAPEPGLGAALLMPAGDLLMFWHFGATLRPGREALISHYTRHDFGYLPPECASYTRRLTAIWAALFLLLAPLHAALLLGVPPLPRCDSGLVLGATLGFTLLMFLGEHVIRSLRFPQHGIATPVRTLRAIRSAHSSRPQPRHHD